MMIKLHAFSCLVAVALSSTAIVLANVIPSSMNADMAYPAYTAVLHNPRINIDDSEGMTNPMDDISPPGTLPVPVPSLPTGSLPVPISAPPVPAPPASKRGFFERFMSGELFRSSTDDNQKRDLHVDLSDNVMQTIDFSKLVLHPTIIYEPRGENRENNNNDIEYLNLALLLSQLEYAFFDYGLNRFSEADFRAAGYAEWVRGRFEQIREHEKAHVEFLQSAVTTSGRDRVLPCDYVFNLNNVQVFVDISYAITTIAASGYIGGLHYFEHREYITILAAILAVESRQAAWINGAVRRQNPWNTAFETPLTPSQVLTLLSEFFDYDNMPSQNRGLLPSGLRPYPRLNLAPRLVPGEEAEISFPYSRQEEGEHLYAAFLVGFETIFVVVNERIGNEGEHHEGNGKGNRNRYYVTIPRDLSARGTVYVSIVRGRDNINNVRFDDASIVAGPAIALFPFDAQGKPINSW